MLGGPDLKTFVDEVQHRLVVLNAVAYLDDFEEKLALLWILINQLGIYLIEFIVHF